MRTPIFVGACVALGAVALPAQQRAATLVAPQRVQKSQEDLAKLRKDKLAKEVFHRAPWLFDYDEARKTAASRNVPIFVYFTRSYAP